MNSTVNNWSRVVGVWPGTTEKQRRTAWRIRRWKTNRHVQCHFGFTPGETAAPAPLLPSKRAGDCAARRPCVHLATHSGGYRM